MKIKHLAAGVGVVGLVFAAGPALATGNSYTVSVGGSSATGTHAVTATSDASLTFQAEKPDGTFLNLTCSSSAVPSGSGSIVRSGTGITDIADLTGVTFSTCTGPGGNLTVTTSGTWKLHGTSAATTGSSDVVAGHIENITANASNAVCRFTVTGGADGSFNEANQKLSVNEQADGTGQALTVSGVSGCLGQIKNGGKAKFVGTYSTTVTGGAINVQP